MSKDLVIFDSAGSIKDNIGAAFKRVSKEVLIVREKVSKESLKLAEGSRTVCVFGEDRVDEEHVEILRANKTGMLVCCCSTPECTNIPVQQCLQAGLQVALIRNYLPKDVAEFCVAAMFLLGKTLKDVSSPTGAKQLEGLCIRDRRCGVVGWSRAGQLVAEKMSRLVKEVVVHDEVPGSKAAHETWMQDKKLENVTFKNLEDVFKTSDILAVIEDCRQEDDTDSLIDNKSIGTMPNGVIIINASRGDVINTEHLLQALEDKKVKGAALDVFEDEREFVFQKMGDPDFVYSGYPGIEKMREKENIIFNQHLDFYSSSKAEESKMSILNFKD